MTVRELYEMILSGEEFETESIEYVELDGGYVQIVIMEKLVLLLYMMELTLETVKLFNLQDTFNKL